MTGLDPANMQLEPVDSPTIVGSLLSAALAADLLAADSDPATAATAEAPVRAALPYWLVRSTPAAELRRYHDDQKRDPDGTWGDGIPGPSTPDGDLDPTSSAEGTYGDLHMGVDNVGDVRWAFREHDKDRVVEITADDLDELHAKLRLLVVDRDDAIDDDTVSSGEIYTDDEFGIDGAHRVELYGNGIIGIVFGGGDPNDDDPYTLLLDPPDEEEDFDDVAGVLDAIDDILNELDDAPAARSMSQRDGSAVDDDEPDGPLDEHTQELLAAISELALAARAKFDPSDHPRNPKGASGGGRFRSNVDKLKDALKAHKAGGGTGDPFEGFDREQLRRVAKARGIDLKRGEDRESIAQKLMAHLDDGKPAATEKPPAPEAPKKRAPRKKAAPKAQAAPQEATIPAPAVAQPAAAYEGPLFRFSSESKRKAGEEVIDLLTKQAFVTGSRYELQVKIGNLEESAVFTDAERGHIYQQAKIAENTERWRRENEPGMSAGDLHADMTRRSREAIAGKPIAVRVTPTALRGILTEGRIKTQFETRRSNGLLDPKYRASMEARWFGLEPGSDPKQRPIYGYVAVDGVRPSGTGELDDILNQYGRIQIVLKDDVQSRTTVTWGDSLTIPDFAIPEPMSNPTWRSYGLATGGISNGELANLDRDLHGQDWRELNYVEAQVHGGVSTSDIAEVILPKAPDKKLRAALDQAGVPWRIA